MNLPLPHTTRKVIVSGLSLIICVASFLMVMAAGCGGSSTNTTNSPSNASTSTSTPTSPRSITGWGVVIGQISSMNVPPLSLTPYSAKPQLRSSGDHCCELDLITPGPHTLRIFYTSGTDFSQLTTLKAGDIISFGAYLDDMNQLMAKSLEPWNGDDSMVYQGLVAGYGPDNTFYLDIGSEEFSFKIPKSNSVHLVGTIKVTALFPGLSLESPQPSEVSVSPV